MNSKFLSFYLWYLVSARRRLCHVIVCFTLMGLSGGVGFAQLCYTGMLTVAVLKFMPLDYWLWAVSHNQRFVDPTHSTAHRCAHAIELGAISLDRTGYRNLPQL